MTSWVESERGNWVTTGGGDYLYKCMFAGGCEDLMEWCSLCGYSIIYNMVLDGGKCATQR